MTNGRYSGLNLVFKLPNRCGWNFWFYFHFQNRHIKRPSCKISWLLLEVHNSFTVLIHYRQNYQWSALIMEFRNFVFFEDWLVDFSLKSCTTFLFIIKTSFPLEVFEFHRVEMPTFAIEHSGRFCIASFDFVDFSGLISNCSYFMTIITITMNNQHPRRYFQKVFS